MIRTSLLSLLLFVGSAAAVQPAPQAKDDKVDFSRDIRPILANNCILCHGLDAKNRKGDLRLDTREGATADLGDGVKAIVAGKPDKSELFRRVSSTDRDEVMPPSKTGKKLARKEIDLLRRWIEQGAPYAKHWSYVKPERPALPPIKDAAWVRNEIDRFILARLEKEGLKPSPETDRYALIRRAALDLTGLPPALEEADKFANDPDPAAYEKLIDRLLASPPFGERWARVWLDMARYADSQGYAEDRPRVIWPYRDWVIQALNDNKPYDQFTVEQLAGDLLPNATEMQIKATAFHRNTLTNTEGGTDDEEFRNVAVVDRVNTTMQVWMGLTFNCAQCHDHKFDPFTQEEYFNLFSFLNSTEDADRGDDSPFLSLYTEEQKRQKKELQDGIAQLEAGLLKTTPELDKAREKWEAGFHKPIAWKPLKLIETPAEDGFIAAPASPTSLRVASDLPSLAAIRIEGQDFGLTKVTASGIVANAKAPHARIVRFELPGAQRILHIAELQVFSGGQNVAPKGKAKQSSVAYEGPAKLANDGNTNGDYFGAKSTTHTNTEDNPWWEVDLGKTLPIDKVAVWNRTDGGEGIMVRTKGYKILLLDEARKPIETRSVDSYPNPSADWSLDGARDIDLRAVAGDAKSPERFYVAAKPFVIAAGTELRIRLEHKAAGKARLTATDDAASAAYLEVPADIRTILRKPAAERSTDEKTKLVTHHRSIAPELQPSREKLAALKKQLQDLKPAATVPILRELAQRRKTHIQVRGNFLVKGKEVGEGVPAVFPPMAEGKGRLALAKWLVHPDNPLTARVAVNRHWEQIFGVGLVTTSEDFGIRGELPSHPELLDWLATEFMAQKWDMKKLLKLLVTSAAYRQSSQVRPELLAKDPSNRLLARGPRNRLDAETVRDLALFVSGLLSRKMLGPSVYPHQPKTGLAAAFSSSTDWEASKGEDKFRRGLYTFWRRSVPYPSMATFDAPDRNVCTVKRVPTNTPLQALVTMNDPVYVECAQALARKIMVEGGASARDRASYGLRRSLARPARPAELDRVVALFEEARSRYATDAKRAASMATEPLGPVPQGMDVVELAAWTVVGNVLLNLDEMFMKR